MATPPTRTPLEDQEHDPAPHRVPPRGAAPSTLGRGLVGRLASAVLHPKNLTLVAVVLVLGYLALTPILYLLYGTFFDDGNLTLGGFQRAYGQSGVASMARNSMIFSIGSASLSFVVGTSLAYVTVRTNVPFRPILVATAVVPLIIPGLLYTIAWIMIASPNIGYLNQVTNTLIGQQPFNIFSMPGMIWVEGTDTVPLVFLFMTAAFRSMDPSLEESALVSGASRLTMLRKVTLPLVRPAIGAAMLIVTVKALESFEVPALLGMPNRIFVFTSRIFLELRNYPYDYGAAGALSLGLIVIAIIGVYAVNRIRGQANELATVTGKGFRPQTIDLGRARPIVAALVIGYFCITTVMPFLVLLYTSLLPRLTRLSWSSFADFSLDNYRTLMSHRVITSAVKNSVMLSLGSATVIIFLTAIAAWLVVRTRVPGRQMVDQLTFLPLVIPGLVMGVAISFVYLRNPLPFQVYGTMWILMIAYVTRFMPYGMRYAVPSLTQISGELEESAAVSGASWFQTGRKIVLPLMLPGLLAGWIYIVIISVRELSSSILLYSPGNEVISIVIWQLNEQAELSTIAAMGVLLVLSLVVFVAVAVKLGAKIGLRSD